MHKVVISLLTASVILTALAGVSAQTASTSWTETQSKTTDSYEIRMEYYNKYIAKGYDVSSIKPYLDTSKYSQEEFWQALRDLQNTQTPTNDTKQKESSAMRMEYYNKYLAKGYDVSSLKPYLDAATTSESDFWEALKKVQNNKEVPERKAYVEKLKSKGYDVSGFTEEIIWDSGKFWNLYKMVESGAKPVMEPKKEIPMNVEPKNEWKKPEMTQKVEEKKTPAVPKISQAQAEKLKATMKARIAKLPADTRDATLTKLEVTLTKSLDAARARNAKLLIARYEVLLAVVQEELNNVDDEALVDALFQ
jgi:hypothetical protein